ncbi:hypothetical protein ACFWPQ_49130 [Streptomyces sp. NPDC058464]|uniref:hypothetical protein n=1 Tax=Streptomyces sp. NPDC058464 TaxID=3346511 RepID=UPI0036531B91
MTSSSTASRDFVEIDDLLAADEKVLRFRWEGSMTAELSIGPNTRLRVRPRLTAARWSGNIDAASRVAAMLTDNAVRHGRPFTPGRHIRLRLMCVAATDELIIEVDDAEPAFPRFEELAVDPTAGTMPTSLWWLHRNHGSLAWQIKRDFDDTPLGKTVQVVLPQRWAQPQSPLHPSQSQGHPHA